MNYFKYSEKDLRLKFANIIQTNHMISQKTPFNIYSENGIPFEKNINFDVIFEDKRESFSNENAFSDLKEMGSTNMSSLMQNPDESIIHSLLRPFETGMSLFQNFQQIVVFKKKDDDFYEYKLKIYEVF